MYSIYVLNKGDPMNIIISNTSKNPIYQQIVDQIKELILKDKLKQGDPLPSIRGLARDLKVSVITTKRAYEELEKEGLIETVQGKGSFVARINREIIREKKLKLVEDKMIEVIHMSRELKFSYEELLRILEVLYREV